MTKEHSSNLKHYYQNLRTENTNILKHMCLYYTISIMQCHSKSSRKSRTYLHNFQDGFMLRTWSNDQWESGHYLILPSGALRKIRLGSETCNKHYGESMILLISINRHQLVGHLLVVGFLNNDWIYKKPLSLVSTQRITYQHHCWKSYHR